MTIHREGAPIEDVGEAYEPDYPEKPDRSDQLVNELKDEALEKMYPTFSNEQLTEIVMELKDIVKLLRKCTEADDKLIADLELRVRELERQGRMKA